MAGSPAGPLEIRIAIGLGGNLGDRQGHLERAVSALGALGHGLRLASLYETPPVGPPQPDYLNSAISLLTTRGPEEVLARALEIERAEGRVRAERWGPRTLDLDLLAGIDALGAPLTVHSPSLDLPHPELLRRAFALAPLLEVLPELERELAPALARLGGPPPRVGLARACGKGWTPTERRK